jgi:hypothetical protein
MVEECQDIWGGGGNFQSLCCVTQLSFVSVQAMKMCYCYEEVSE